MTNYSEEEVINLIKNYVETKKKQEQTQQSQPIANSQPATINVETNNSIEIGQSATGFHYVKSFNMKFKNLDNDSVDKTLSMYTEAVQKLQKLNKKD